MSQFDIYRNNNLSLREFVPFLMDVQADVLSGLSTRMVAPLEILKAGAAPVERLTPVFEVEGHRVVLLPMEMAGISIERLGPPITNLACHRDRIFGAIDFFLHGE
jgi:toxin CcdB